MRNALRRDNRVGARRAIAMAVVFAAACLLGIASARTAGGEWTVAAVHGVATVFADQIERHAAMRGYPAVDGSTVLTGADGTILLVRRDNSIMIYPNSEVTLPRTASDRRLGVVQMSGEVLYRMQTPEAGNFEVRTPYFAAIVGRTVFTIAVAADRATVSVAKGMVRVVPIRGGQAKIVHAGDRVSVIAGSADHVVVESIDPSDPSFWDSGGVSGGPPPGQSGAAGPPGGGQGRSGSKNGSPGGGQSKGGEPGDGQSKGDDHGGGQSKGDDHGGGQSKGDDHGGGQSKGGGSKGNSR